MSLLIAMSMSLVLNCLHYTLYHNTGIQWNLSMGVAKSRYSEVLLLASKAQKRARYIRNSARNSEVALLLESMELQSGLR